MNTNIEEQRDKIIEELELLNGEMVKQNSVKHIFMRGIIYGVGFFIGSAILATIALGALAPWLGQIDWIRDTFTRGEEMVR